MTGMRRIALFALMLTLVAPLVAAPRKAAPKPAPEPKLMQSCEAHKFEAVVDTVVDNQPRKSKVKLCGVEGQSDADWIGTLRDAIRKLDANKDMAPATRDQIVAAIKAEIGRLSIVESPIPAKRQAQGQSPPPLSRDYAALPPLPAAPETPVGPPPPVETSTGTAASAAPPVSPPAAAQAVAVPGAMPRLTIRCETPSDLGGPAPCAEFERETRLIIQADGDVPAGALLQFIRNGRTQGDISLAGLGRGGVLRDALPPGVCAGFGAGRLELRIVQAAGAQVLQSEGPYSLRC
ncbi:MAG: hypothetical protein ABI853_07920 [Sphingomicrobium sp.]